MTREEAITYLKVIWNRYKAEYEIERETLDAYHMAIEALQTLEAVERIKTEVLPQTDLVRCKDCKWHECGGLPCPLDLCESLGDDGFCSRGERREP